MPFDEKMLQDAIGEIAPDEETLPIEQAKGPGFRRDALTEAIQQETATADRRNASVAALNTSAPDVTSPDQVASILKLARDSGYPAEGLLDGQSFKSISSEYMRGLNQHILNSAPAAARTLSADPWMAKIMSDSLENGAEIERIFRESGFGTASRKARKEADRMALVAEEAEARAVSRVAAVEDTPGDVALSRSRALLSGVLQDVGAKSSGAAELWGVAAKGIAAPILALGGDTAREILETDIGFDPARTFLKNPGESLKAIGRALRGQQEGFDLDVLAGLGQFASQAAIYYASGGAAGAISNLGLMAQGADIMAGKTAKDDAEPWLRDLATVGGGGITAITEKLGMDVVFGKLAVPFSNKFAALASRVLIGGAAEGYQELGESLLQDVLRIHTTNPTAEIELAQAIKEGNVGFAVGLIARGAVEGMLHIKSRGQTRVAQSEAERMQELFRLAMDSKARARDPQTFEAFMQSVSEDATVFVDSATLATVLQEAGLDPDVLPSFTEAARAEAANVGPGIEIPVSELVTRLSGTPAAEAIVEHLRTDPDSPTLAEARAAGDRATEFFQQEAERILNEQEQTDAFREAAQTVEQDLLTQLETVSPFGKQANKGYAALTGAFYTTIASRLGITPVQLRDGWTDAQGVEHRGYALQVRGREGTGIGRPLQQTPTATADTFTGAGVRSLLEQDDWTIMTAENPAAVELSPEENLARNAAFEAELQRRGISYTPVKGSYGRLENSFALWGLSAAQASALGQEFGQESVLTRHGLLYPDGTVERATGVTVHDTPPEDFFTTLPDGTTFTVDLDFDSGRTPLFTDAGLAQAAVFTPEEQAIADRFEDWATNDPGAVEAYISRFGSEVDPDKAKELSPEYVADPMRMARVVHEGSSILAKRVYTHLLKTAPEGAFVAFSAGGGGSGKSETLSRMVPKGSEQPGVLYDSVLGNYDSAQARIEQALASGRSVRILYTNRPVMKAWRFALHRARVVPASALAKAHQGASDTIRRLKAEYEGNDQVNIFISNNLTDNLSDLALGTIDDVYSYDYNEVVEQLEAEARRQYEEGQIDEARFRAATGAEVGGGNGRSGQEGVRGQVAGASGAGAGAFAQSYLDSLAPGKPVPASVSAAADITNAQQAAGGKLFEYNRDLKVEIQNLVLAAAKGLDLTAETRANFDYLVSQAASEALRALDSNPGAVGWYDEKTGQALSVLSELHPEILTDPEARFAFIYALAVTSNGQKVAKNFELAERAYLSFKSTGRMPSDVGAGGPQRKALHNSLALYNSYVEQFGSAAELEQFMLSEFTVKELEALGFKIGGEAVTERVLGASILGPKIGNGFFANLYGRFDQLTIDRWLMRTWGRWTGSLLADNKQAIKDETKILKDIVRQVRDDKESLTAARTAFAMAVSGKVIPSRLKDFDTLVKSRNFVLVAEQLRLKSTYPEIRKVLQSTPLTNEMRKSGNRLFHKLDGQVEAPQGAAQRTWVRAVFAKALTQVNALQREKGAGELTMADLQALLWYPERRLYDSAKNDESLESYDADEAPDYANAAAELARKQGVSPERIAAALADPGRRPTPAQRIAGVAGPGRDGAQDSPADAFAQSATERLTRPPRNEDGSVTLWHYGKVPALSELDPAMSGQGIAGADIRRRDADPDNWSNRTYYGLAVGQPGGYVKESGLGDNLYSGNLPMSRLYDMAADPDGLRPAKSELSGWDNATSVYETRIKNAGYAGYWVSSPQLGLTAAVFEKVPVRQTTAPATLAQQQGADRGSFSPQTLDLALLANADLSTFLHETGHFFLTVYSDLALSPDAPAGLRGDMQKLLDWFGPDLTPETWATMTLEQQRPHHEKFAESFEQYLFSGQAPRAELAPLFRRFASWLTKVYSSLTRFAQTNKGAKLSPEIAAVMDRMLATDEEIAAAKQAREYSAFFASAAEAGMSPADFAAYLSLDEDTRLRAEETLRTRGLRDMQWLQNRRNKTLTELQKQAAARRKEVRAAVEAEVQATPLYRTIQWLKTGETTQEDGTAIKAEQGFKLSIPDLEAMFPEGALVPAPNWRGLRTGKTGMLAKEGLHPDLVADMFGFRSGEDLVRQLVDARPIKDEIEGLTDQRMLEQYGDLSSPEALSRAADEALHNEARTRMVATELSALKAAVGSPRALMKAAREYAEQLIGRRTSKTLRPWEFAAAELRAGKAALEALRSGDRELAAKHKRAELLNHSAAKAAHAAVAEIERTVSRLRDIAAAKDDSSRTKSRDMDTVNAVRVVLAAYGFGTSARTAKAHTYVDALKHNNPEAGDALGEIITTLTEGAKDWRGLTVSELRDLRDGVNALWSHARRSRQIEIDGKRIALADAVKDLRDTMARKGIPARAPGQGHAVTKAEARKMTFQTVLAKLRRVSQWADAMDGGPYGAFRRYIWYPIKDAADKYRTARAEYIGGKYNALLQAIAPELKPGLIDAREIGYVFGKGSSGVGKLELLHAVLHTGNASNKRKLLLGRGWATLTPDGDLDTSKWDAFMSRMYREGVLQARDYDFAQGVWDLMEELKGGAQQAHRTVFGRYFDEVTAETVTTPFGAYRGGYVPATVDTAQVPDAALRQLAEAENQNMQHSFPATQRGFTKARVEYNRPLALDLRVLSSHIDKVLLFTHMTPPVTDVHRLLRSEGVASDLNKIDAGVLNGMLIPWLNRSARQVVEEQTETAAVIDGVLRRLRRNMGMGLMFANVINTLQQFSGLALSSVKVKGRYLAGAAAHYASRPTETLEFVTAHSTFMHERLNNLNALMYDQVEEILVNPNVYEKAQNWSGRHAYVFQTMADRVLAPITWLGAYNQALESAPATMSEEGRETYARRLADSAVQETQMDQTPEGIAAFESGSAFRRMFTQFAGFFNMTANTMAAELSKAKALSAGQRTARAAYVIMFAYLIPAALSEIIAKGLRGGPDDEEGDGYLNDWLSSVGWGTLSFGAAMVPFAGQGINAVLSSVSGRKYDERVLSAPAIGALEATFRAPVSIYNAMAEDHKPSTAIRDTATAVAAFTGLPATALAKPIAYTSDIATGYIEPTGPFDAIRGIITGTASPESK